jgi:hypothetical protein
MSFPSRIGTIGLRRVLVISVCLLLLGTGPAALADRPSDPGPALDHPAIREVLSMVEAGVGSSVILARIEKMEKIPELTGEQIAALKKHGVGDRVLLALIERGGKATRPSPPRSRNKPPIRQAGIHVTLERSFAVHYVEVRLDGQTVNTLGSALAGESEPAHFLARPKPVRLGEERLLFEGGVEPGRHEIEVGFAVTRIDGDPQDEWHEYSREVYRSSGAGLRGHEIRAAEAWADPAPAICELKPGQVCEIVATPVKRTKSRRGGLPVYDLDYEVRTR